jgi:hypothetical protein
MRIPLSSRCASPASLPPCSSPRLDVRAALVRSYGCAQGQQRRALGAGSSAGRESTPRAQWGSLTGPRAGGGHGTARGARELGHVIEGLRPSAQLTGRERLAARAPWGARGDAAAWRHALRARRGAGFTGLVWAMRSCDHVTTFGFGPWRDSGPPRPAGPRAAQRSVGAANGKRDVTKHREGT